MPMAVLRCPRTRRRVRWCSCEWRRMATSRCCRGTRQVRRRRLWSSSVDAGAFAAHALHRRAVFPEGLHEAAFGLVIEIRSFGGAALLSEQGGEIDAGERDHGMVGGKTGLLDLQS